MDGGKRHFTVDMCEVENIGGDFVGKNPGQAARKAARKIFKLKPRSKMVQFTLRETTADSKQKSFTYVATKVDLPEPKVIQRGPVSITVTNEIIVKAVKA